MTLLNSSTLKADELSQFEVHQLYCGLDNCVTHESLTAELNLFKNNKNPRPQAEYIYGFERALQAPYMDVMMRGFAVDVAAREVACADLRDRVEHYKFRLDQMAGAIWDKGLNPRSNKMLREFFYDTMRFKEIITSRKGVRKVSLDRTALEKLYDMYLYARPFVNHILSIRDLSRQLEVLSTDVDSDNRFRSSYNIAGTECISGDSLVWTKGGLRKIREIYETPHEVAVYNGSRFVIPARKVMFFERDGKRIILEGGFKIECSLNHPLKTAQGFVKAKDLKAGISIEINNGLPLLFGQHALPRGGIIEQMSEDFCELYGMLLADGSLNVNPTHKRARLANSDKRVRDRFLLLAKLVFNVEGKESGDEAWFSSVTVCTWLKKLGFPADEGLGTARYKYIPRELMRGKPNLIRALLRGLTLDTHITDKGLMFGTQSLEMREQIQQCLLILGIVSNKMQMGDSIKLNVSRAYCGRFISLIGFVQSQKLIKLATLIGERCQWHEPIQPMTKTFLRINQIEDWKGDVYDLTMPENSLPQYVAQGMTVHNTGRPSSSENAFGTGGNAQNIAPGLRHVFIADSGYTLVVIDFEQSEARDLGFMIGCLFGDWSYLDSCESGDLHTSNARLVWPELKWTGDAKEDKRVASERFYRDFSYRDMAKRGGHLCLTPDHEVLTPHGWVPITQKPGKILQWSERYSNFTEVTNWYDSVYEGDIHQFEGNSVSVMMTADHRVPYKTDQRNADGIKVRKASEGPGVHMPLGWGYVGGNIDIPARLIAAFMSDGYQASKNRIQFHLKKDRKIRRLKHLCNLYGYQLDTLANDKFAISAEFPKQAGPHMLYWTRECINDFLDEYKYWDGSIGKTSVSLFSVNKAHIEWIQTLGRIRGIGGNIRESITTTNFSGQSKTYETKYYSLQQNKRRWASGKNMNWTKERVNSIRILCPTVESGFFYIRRNGKICVTGNSNYMGTAFTMARHLKIPQRTAEEFQDRYCRGPSAAFPCITQYWQWAIEQIQTSYKIVTPFGRERHFFGDPHDDATAREAIAFVPQSTTADRTNLGFWRTWKHVPNAQLLAQGYDSITFQVLDDANMEDTIRHVAHLLETPLEDQNTGRVFSVPVECKVGRNWGYASKDNPDGLKHFPL